MAEAKQAVFTPEVFATVKPVTFTMQHADDDPVVDLSINDDLVDTRSSEDQLAVFKDVAVAKVASVSWITPYHGAYNISNRNGAYTHIVCHYTGAGSNTAGNAKNNCIYFSGGNRNASAHYFIDDGGIWEYADPDQYYTWHCGDGGGKYGINNRTSIGIEVCMNGDSPYTGTEIGYLKQLVSYLMNKYKIPATNVCRHYDASRKLCPWYYAGEGDRHTRWHALWQQITSATSTPSGWQKDSKGWWYQNADGTYPKSSWKIVDGYWYYFNSEGYAVTNWQFINGHWYYFRTTDDPVCSMYVGWLFDGRYWYYMRRYEAGDNPAGSMIAGEVVTIDGEEFGFAKDGRLMDGMKPNGALYIKADAKPE